MSRCACGWMHPFAYRAHVERTVGAGALAPTLQASKSSHYCALPPFGVCIQTINYDSCDIGLKVKPSKGDALMFWNLHPNRTFDKFALHGGCPVKQARRCFSSPGGVRP